MASKLRERIHSAIWLPSGSDGSPPLLRPQAVYPVLAVVVIALGLNWPFMSIGLRSISPIWMAAFRLIGATFTLGVLASATGRLARPPRQDLPIVLSVAVFRLALTFILVFSALEIVPPGRSSILVWTTSLWTVPIAVLFVGERMNRLRWLGLTAGITGILFVFEPLRLDWTDGRVVLGHAMLLTAAILNASVSVHVRHHSWKSTPLGLLPWQMLTAALPVLVIAFVTEGIPTINWTLALAAIVVYQGTFASGVAIWGQFTVLRSHPAISTNLALMAVPVIGLLSSAVLVDEPLSAGVLIGLGLVLAGVAASMVADSGSWTVGGRRSRIEERLGGG